MNQSSRRSSKDVERLAAALERSRADIEAGRTIPLSEALAELDGRIRQRERDRRAARKAG